MESWPEQHRRLNKRTYNEMSHPLPLPRQQSFPYTSANPEQQMSFTGSALTFPTLPPPGRRSSHPHNEPRQPYDNMADGNRVHITPSLQHQTSRTIIDLTDDLDVPESQPESQNRRSSQRSSGPPQLERSDRTTLGDIISIDSDGDDDIEIVSERQLPRPLPAPPIWRQATAHGHYHHNLSPRRPREVRSIFGDTLAHHEHNQRVYQNFASIMQEGFVARLGFAAGFTAQPIQQRMPGQMNYQHHAFARSEPSRKEEHVPPPPAREGFTRSPKEDDVVVCPACDGELMVGPEEQDTSVPNKKPGGKQRSKKDREEHPFWVVRECGHVYCNKCYQSRKPDQKSTKNLFPDKQTGNKKIPVCAVEGCEKEVGDKGKWVGVFL